MTKSSVLMCIAALLALLGMHSMAWANCEIPYGIYDDQARIRL